MTFLLATAERIGLHPRFYWMVQEGAAPLDGRYPLASGPALRMLQGGERRSIQSVFIQAIYLPKILACLRGRLNPFRIFDGIGASTFQLAGRRHYLRWRPET